MISMDMPRSWINLESIFKPDIFFLKNDVLIPCFSCTVMINWNGRIKDGYRSIEMGNFVVKTLARMHPRGVFPVCIFARERYADCSHLPIGRISQWTRKSGPAATWLHGRTYATNYAMEFLFSFTTFTPTSHFYLYICIA